MTTKKTKKSKDNQIVQLEEPKFKIVDMFVEKIEKNDQIKWVLNLVDANGEKYKYDVNV